MMYTPAREPFSDLRLHGVLYTERSWVPFDFVVTATELTTGTTGAKDTYGYDFDD